MRSPNSYLENALARVSSAGLLISTKLPLLMIASLCSAMLLVTSASAEASHPKHPVKVGGHSYDACPARVVELAVQHGQSLPVRSGPGSEYPEIGQIHNPRESGEAIFLCDFSDSGEWRGIVYTSEDPAQCNVSKANRSERVPYDGPCAQGWIRASDIRDFIE
jgi:hypothetical protein